MDWAVMIPYSDLMKLLEAAKELESLRGEMKSLRTQYTALRAQFLEVMEEFGELKTFL